MRGKTGIAMPASRDDLMQRFQALDIKTTTLDHAPVFTVAESSALERDLPGGHTKNLFLKDKKGRLFLVVALNDAVIDLKSIHTRIGARGRVSFGKPDLLMQYLGVTPGSVTPFSLINDTDQQVTPVLDAAMMEHEVLNYHPLLNNATTTIARADLLSFIRSCGHDPQIIAVSNEALQPAGEL
jgi:Ala-tRNA(Pro) deacylase